MSIFPSRISLFENPLHKVRGFGPGSDLMDLVFTHEYTHYVHITEKRGWYGALTDVIGPGLEISNVISPGWAVEGITTSTETMFTDGGRGRSPLFKGEMLSFRRTETVGINAASVVHTLLTPGSRIYLGGYFMVDYLNRTYGSDAFARMSRYQAEHPLGGTGEALKAVTGQYPHQFYFLFLRDLEAQAPAARDKALSAGLASGTPVLSASACLDSFAFHFWSGLRP
jgi:hypothetical protein